MASNPAATLTSTLQSASLNRHPSPTHDINPSTAASSKEPVTASTHPQRRDSSSTTSSISVSALRPVPRRAALPPLPDLRFEQSYLASLKDAKTNWDVAWVTMRDQVFMPLLQGTIWTLMLNGWRFWNRGVMMQGEGWGAKARRWWWGVNNWALPEEAKQQVGGRPTMARDEKFAGEVGDYYTTQFAAGHGD